MIQIERLTWDSNFFRLNIGKLFLHDDLSFVPEDFLREASRKFDIVYVFSNQMLTRACAAELELVDIMIGMSQPMPKTEEFGYSLKSELSEQELAECYEIAEQTAEVSRFFHEPLIGKEKAKALYRRWIDNSVNQQFADGILIEKLNDKIIGIHVIKSLTEENSGLCSLIGVNREYKGHGVGKKLWHQAFGYWNNLSQINKCKVHFSIKNSDSFNFHLKIGFNKVEETKYVYHYRNKYKSYDTI